MKRLVAIGLPLIGGCAASQGPTPIIVYVTPAPSVAVTPSATAATMAASQTASPSSRPADWIELVPCDLGMQGGNGEPITYADKDCQNQSYHITNPVELGKVATLTFTVTNTGSKTSGPISAVMFGCSSFGRCTHTEYFLPDRFDLIGCKPRCTSKVVSDDTTWELQWNIRLAPTEVADLVVTFRARYAAYNYIVAGLYAGPVSQVSLGSGGARLIRDWGDMQVVVYE